MKALLFAACSIWLISCRENTSHEQAMQKTIDSLQQKMAAAYKPGFGEFMSSIQTHHAKLWFAGQNQNWALCDFEIHEIMEALDNIQQYQQERKESRLISMINPALDSLDDAIKKQDPVLFKGAYISLTHGCNNCHHAADFGFNIVKVPETSAFSNQDFRK